jgi:hypothetical protein
MTEDKKHKLDELDISDIVSYLGARTFSMKERIRLQSNQLADAKEILKQWLQTSKAGGCDNIKIVADTEQFLKEE